MKKINFHFVASFFMNLVICFVIHGAAQAYIVITVAERGGVQRVHEYVQFGLPLPRSWNVTDVSSLRLSDSSGTPVPAQFEALARWGSHAGNSTAPVKWVLVGYFESMAPHGKKIVRLDHSGPGPSPAMSIQINEAIAGKLTIHTGAAGNVKYKRF